MRRGETVFIVLLTSVEPADTGDVSITIGTAVRMRKMGNEGIVISPRGN
jgi:hypothetical protein